MENGLTDSLKKIVLHIKELKLSNFKNYDVAALEFSEGLNSFIGLNGSGKTNLLDAIYLTCMTKSYFNVTDRQVVKYEEKFYRIDSKLLLKENPLQVVVKFQSGQKKIVEKNKVPYDRLADHVGLLPIVMIAPDDIKLIQDSGEVRRKFMDNVLCQDDAIYLTNLMSYNQLIKQRNAALKEIRKANQYDQTLINIYDDQMIGPATYIHEKRTAFLDAFLPVFKGLYAVISDGTEPVDIKYKSQLNDTDYKTLLAKTFEKDFYVEYTSTGIHRDDLTFVFSEKALKKFASQGQRKSFLISLKLAQYEFLRRKKNIKPILLLDDIFDKLDENRVAKVINLLQEETFGQVFITDTDEKRISRILEKMEKPHLEYIVTNGKIASYESAQ